MCTWPLGGKRQGWEKHWQFGYFNECMSGYEYQVAAHMLWEGVLKGGLAVTRAIHDRYDASLRNPYNEIECSDHYARAMASFGVYLAACGYEYHGPKGVLGFAPRLRPEDFRAAFTAAEGWGTFSQRRTTGKQTEQIHLKYGSLRVRHLRFQLPEGARSRTVTAAVDGQVVNAAFAFDQGRLTVDLQHDLDLRAGNRLRVEIELQHA